jgi:3-methyl-2-oxobutanoate hydroxymethyltransferase
MYGPSSRDAGTSQRPARKITVPEIRARKGRAVTMGGTPVPPRISMITAYDFTMARLLDEGGADVLLVGDSLGMVIQGHPTTLPVTVDEICYHGRAVARGARVAHVVGDMPFMSFQVSAERALENAGKMIKEGGFESIKLEGGEEVAPHVRRIVAAGIPVMGHVGLTPQSVHAMGGFKVQGKDEEAAERVLAGARALEDAGAYAIVLEAIPPDLAAAVTAAVSVPTIGIGAGPSCDGQVLVCYDLLGMFPDLQPKFAKRFAQVGEQIVAATRAYVAEVQDHSFPGPEHTFKPSGLPLDGHAPRAPKPRPHAEQLPTQVLRADDIPPHWQTH